MFQSTVPRQVNDLIQDLVPGYRFDEYQKLLRLCYTYAFYPRRGAPSMPFRYDQDFFQSVMPVYDPTFSMTFEEITDDRCRWLQQNCNDRPWLIEYSGGIDSTVILCAFLRNLSEEELKNVTVALNKSSIYENPGFFHDHVLGQFNLVDITSEEFDQVSRTHYMINGEPADMLTGSGLALHAANSRVDMSRSWRDQPDQLLEFLATTIIGDSGSQWLYERMQINLDGLGQDDPPIDTVTDWFWWINFCWKWPQKTLWNLQRQTDYQGYKNRLICWYDTPQYQSWSMVRGRYSLIVDGPTIGDYKKDSKRYISSIYPDQYLQKFKIKIASSSVVLVNRQPWFCMLDDFTVLNPDTEMDSILELIPQHLNYT